MVDSYKKALKKAEERHKNRERADFEDYTYYKVLGEIQTFFPNQSLVIETPPEHIDADLALTGDPEEMGKKAEEITSGDFQYIEKAESEGPFLNIYLNHENLFQTVLKNITDLSDQYGTNNQHEDKLAVIEYSAPNIAKPIGIGHLRSTIIGQVLSNIYEASGYTVFRDNYLGDWGTQFGKVIYAYQTWGEDKELNIENLKSLYVKFQEESEDNKEIIEEARDILKNLEEGDKELTELWQEIRELSINEFKEVYNLLGVEFDHYGGERMFVEEAREAAKDCLEKQICKRGEEDAVIAEIDDLPTFLMEKGDGTTLYHSRDLAQLKYRVEELNPDQILYVVGNEQELHFRQLFALADHMEYLTGVKPKHIGFGLILGEDGKKMSTRRGTGADLKKLINKSIKKSLSIVDEKNPDLSEKQKKQIAEDVGIGAIVYNDISQSRNKDITFDWDQMLDFEAGSAAYLQYTHARINSIEEKYKEEFGKVGKINLVFKEEIELELTKKLMFFPQVISNAKENDAPHIIATYLEELAGTFNTFYNKISIIKTESKDLRLSRLHLALGVGQVLKNGLELLNVPTPEKM